MMRSKDPFPIMDSIIEEAESRGCGFPGWRQEIFSGEFQRQRRSELDMPDLNGSELYANAGDFPPVADSAPDEVVALDNSELAFDEGLYGAA